MKTQKKQIDISVATIFKVTAALLFIALLFQVWKILAALFIAAVIASALEPTLHWLEKRKLPRFVSVPTIYIVAIAVLFGIFYAILPTLFNEIFLLSQDLPQRLSDATEALVGSTALGNIDFLVPAVNEFLVNFQERIGAVIPNLFNFISRIFGGVLSFLLVIVFSFYLSLRRKDLEKSLLAVTPETHKDTARLILHRIQRKTGRWMQALFILSVFVGITTYIMLYFMGVEAALTLAILAGLMEFIPFLGPITAGIAIFLLASMQSFALGLLAVAGFTIIQQVEVNFVSPMIMSRAVGFNPLYIILFVLVGAQLAGFWGIIIAIPLAAAIAELVSGIKQHQKA